MLAQLPPWYGIQVSHSHCCYGHGSDHDRVRLQERQRIVETAVVVWILLAVVDVDDEVEEDDQREVVQSSVHYEVGA